MASDGADVTSSKIVPDTSASDRERPPSDRGPPVGRHQQLIPDIPDIRRLTMLGVTVSDQLS